MRAFRAWVTSVASLPFPALGQSTSVLWPSAPPCSRRFTSTFLLSPTMLEQVVLQDSDLSTGLINVNCFSFFELRPHWLASPIIDQRWCSFATQFKLMESYSSIYRWKKPDFNHLNRYRTPPLQLACFIPRQLPSDSCRLAVHFSPPHICALSPKGNFKSNSLWPCPVLTEQLQTKLKRTIFIVFLCFDHLQ